MDNNELFCKLALYKARSGKTYIDIAKNASINPVCMQKFTSKKTRRISSPNMDKLIEYLQKQEINN